MSYTNALPVRKGCFYTQPWGQAIHEIMQVRALPYRHTLELTLVWQRFALPISSVIFEQPQKRVFCGTVFEARIHVLDMP